MRPNHLNSYFASLVTIKGVGPKMAQSFARLLRGDPLAEARRIDLLLHMPVSLIDRSLQSSVATAPEGAIVTVCVTIDKHLPPPRGNKRVPYRVLAHDETDELTLTYFHAKGGYLERQMPVGEMRYVSGRLERFNGAPQITHPDHVVSEKDFAAMPLIEPVYPMTAGVSGKVVQKTIRAALEELEPLPEWQDASVIRQESFMTFLDALNRVHHPMGLGDIALEAPARRRLAYDESLASQLALSLVRANVKKAKGIARQWSGQLRQRLEDALPFRLTGSQQDAIADIEADLKVPERMLRLVQGDVGSGKTMVALIAAADVIESGAQAAMMAPTDLLARQHYQSMKDLCEAVGIRIAVMTGKDTAATKRATLAALEAGGYRFSGWHPCPVPAERCLC